MYRDPLAGPIAYRQREYDSIVYDVQKHGLVIGSRRGLTALSWTTRYVISTFRNKFPFNRIGIFVW